MPTFALPPLERDAEHNARLGEGGLSLHLLDDDAWLLQGEAGSVEFGVDVPPPLLAPAGSDAAASAAAVALPPAGAAAPPQDGGPSTPTQGAEALRCLDYTHGAGCSRCTSAPPAEDHAQWVLAGDAGLKNGEKRLKHQVLHSPEWADSGAREALAAAVLPSYPSLAAVLRRAETSASLRKPHYFVLARAWGYKSDIWMPARSDAQPAKWAAKAPRRGKGGSPSSGGGESVSV